jgi:hypothetical protein
MARAYMVKGTETQRQQCAQCGYTHQNDMETREVYRVEDDNILFEDDDYHYFPVTVYLPTMYVWRCYNCEEWMADEPELITESTWKCGVCECNHDNEDDARGCCQ